MRAEDHELVRLLAAADEPDHVVGLATDHVDGCRHARRHVEVEAGLGRAVLGRGLEPFKRSAVFREDFRQGRARNTRNRHADVGIRAFGAERSAPLGARWRESATKTHSGGALFLRRLRFVVASAERRRDRRADCRLGARPGSRAGKGGRSSPSRPEARHSRRRRPERTLRTRGTTSGPARVGHAAVARS